jgi:hypothetical protein
MVKSPYGYGLQGEKKNSDHPKGEQRKGCTGHNRQRGRFVSVHGGGVQIEIVQSVAVHGVGSFTVTGYWVTGFCVGVWKL